MNLGNCDVCGRELQGYTSINGMDFCAKCYQETFGNIEINKLQQQLADRDVKIEVLQKDVNNLHRTLEEANEELAEKDKEIKQLKQEIENNQRDYVSELAYFTAEENVKQIREQVCDEIREELLKKLGYKNNTYLYREQEAYRDGINLAINITHKLEKGE